MDNKLSSLSMNINYIRTFVVVGQSRNLTEASKKLNVDPSVISRHIKSLESELGIKLISFESKQKELVLTESGKTLHSKYEKVYNEIILIEKEFRQTKKLDSCKITIGVSQDLDDSILQPKIIEFSELYPNVSIKIIIGDLAFLRKKLLQYNVDFIINKNNIEDPNVSTQKISAIPYCLFYKKGTINNSTDLSSIPLVLLNSQNADRMLIKDYLKEKGINNLKVKLEVENIDRMVSYVKNGVGVGISLKDNIKNIVDIEYKELDLSSDIYISYLKENLSPSTKEFLKLFNIVG